jgi:hypothetical protein
MISSENEEDCFKAKVATTVFLFINLNPLNPKKNICCPTFLLYNLLYYITYFVRYQELQAIKGGERLTEDG